MLRAWKTPTGFVVDNRRGTGAMGALMFMSDRPMIEVTGTLNTGATGSDGEPLVVDADLVSYASDWRPLV